jgi:hypothetical protein
MKEGVDLCMNIMLTLPDGTYIFRNLIIAVMMMMMMMMMMIKFEWIPAVLIC